MAQRALEREMRSSGTYGALFPRNLSFQAANNRGDKMRTS